jgi:hypothetical protein
VLQRQGLQTLEGETLGVVQLGLGRLLFSTYNFNTSSEKKKKSVTCVMWKWVNDTTKCPQMSATCHD